MAQACGAGLTAEAREDEGLAEDDPLARRRSRRGEMSDGAGGENVRLWRRRDAILQDPAIMMLPMYGRVKLIPTSFPRLTIIVRTLFSRKSVESL